MHGFLTEHSARATNIFLVMSFYPMIVVTNACLPENKVMVKYDDDDDHDDYEKKWSFLTFADV